MNTRGPQNQGLPIYTIIYVDHVPLDQLNRRNRRNTVTFKRVSSFFKGIFQFFQQQTAVDPKAHLPLHEGVFLNRNLICQNLNKSARSPSLPAANHLYTCPTPTTTR